MLSTARPSASAPTSGDSGKCSECGHEREGLPADETANRRSMLKGRALAVPMCSSGFDMGFGDVDACECEHPSHSERLTTSPRLL